MHQSMYPAVIRRGVPFAFDSKTGKEREVFLLCLFFLSVVVVRLSLKKNQLVNSVPDGSKCTAQNISECRGETQSLEVNETVNCALDGPNGRPRTLECGVWQREAGGTRKLILRLLTTLNGPPRAMTSNGKFHVSLSFTTFASDCWRVYPH